MLPNLNTQFNLHTVTGRAHNSSKDLRDLRLTVHLSFLSSFMSLFGFWHRLLSNFTSFNGLPNLYT